MKLYRLKVEGLSYSDAIAEDPNVKFPQIISESNPDTEQWEEVPGDNSAVIQKLEEAKYEQRGIAGLSFIRKMGAQLNLDTTKPANHKQKLDETFRPIRDALVVGFWKTAQREMEKINPNNIPELDQSLYDYVKGVIDNFVASNY